MIKRIFQTDSVPLTLMSVLVTLCIYIGTLYFGSLPTCDLSGLSSIFPVLATGPLKYILIALLLFFIPIGFRRSLGRTGILDFNERVSLYPLSLLLLTAIPSCNNLFFLFAAALVLMLVSRIIRIKEGDPTSPVAFVGGVIIALSTWISPFFLLLTLFLWMAISTLSSLSWRTLIWSILGLISPIYLYVTVHYIVTGDLPELSFDGTLQSEPLSVEGVRRVLLILYIGFFLGLLIFMIFNSFRAASKGIVIRRKIIRLGIILFIITATISALIFQFEGASPFLSILAIPLAIVFQEMYRTGRAWVYSVIFLVWLCLTIAISWV